MAGVLPYVLAATMPIAAWATRDHDDPHNPHDRHDDIVNREHHKVERNSKSAPLDIQTQDWWWVPIVVLGIFVLFMLSTRKIKRLHGHSVRHALTKYFSIDALYHTLDGAKTTELEDQRKIEIGHQVLQFGGVALLASDWAINTNRDERYAVAALTSVQLVFMFATAVVDCVLLYQGFVRPVRSVNTKLRWAHCIYQVFLFCTDAISTNFGMAIPVDCFVWATLHYSYEAIGLALEGLNIIGMSELAIIIIVNAKLLTADSATTGWRCAFALSSLALSSASMLAGLVYKLTHLHFKDRLLPEVAAGEHGSLEAGLVQAAPTTTPVAGAAAVSIPADAPGSPPTSPPASTPALAPAPAPRPRRRTLPGRSATGSRSMDDVAPQATAAPQPAAVPPV